MKYNTLKATFKNGLVSPRLRGREKEGIVTSSAEKIENFIIDKVGGAYKRAGLQMPYVHPFTAANDDIAREDTYPLASTEDAVFFAVSLRGEDYIFRFNTNEYFNNITREGDDDSSEHYQSTWLTVIKPDGEVNSSSPLGGSKFYQRVRPFAPYTALSSSPQFQIEYNKFAFSEPYNANLYFTGLLDYLQRQVIPTQMTKVSDATVVFTSNTFSFTVTLTEEYIVTGGISQGLRQAVFVVLPYFVNVRQFIANLQGVGSGAASKCPIQPINFPFNSVNTDTSLPVTILEFAGQTGGVTSDGVLTTSTQRLQYLFRIPRTAIKFEGIEDEGSLVGKFIAIPNATNVRDVVFFITKFFEYNGSYADYFCLRVTGGTPEPVSTRWKLSTFGGDPLLGKASHPRAVAYAFGRLMYANSGVDESRWWASAVHPSSPTNFQGFMGFSLTQDATSDVSGMLYEGISTPTITDPFRYGFVDRVPNISPISFIDARRRIHFGTLEGECQAQISSNSFNKISYEQNIVRSNSASAFPSTRGDGKIFYIANNGKDIRYLSTEDADYESIDGLLTTSLEGLDLKYNKILWCESLSALIVRTTKNRIFTITFHADTQVQAITELVFDSSIEVFDFCVVRSSLFFAYKFKDFIHVSKYAPTSSTPDNVGNDVNLCADLSVCYPSVSGELQYANLYTFFIGETITLFYNGIEYEIEIPSSYNGDWDTIDLPVDISEATVENPAFFYGKKLTAKIRTMPISEGGGNDSAVGDVTRIDRVLVQVDNSGPFKIGNEGGTIYDAEGVQLSPLSTKYAKFDMPQSPDIENHLYIESDSPTPLNISGVAYRGVSNNGA